MSFSLDEWYNKLRKSEVVIEYKGAFTSELISNLLDITESKLDELATPSKIRKKLYNTLVEALQNLYHHSSKNAIDGQEPVFGAVILTKIGEYFKLILGNYTDKEHKQFLTDRIEQINSLSVDELKQLYKMILDNKEFSEKGGGGLGMIDIARKTGSKLEYSFYQVDENNIFFELIININ
jgi:hypothetical protein